IKLDPKNGEAWSNRGNTHRALGQLDKALADHDKAVNLDPNDPRFRINRGATYGDLRQYDKAIADYNEAIKPVSNFAPQALNNLAWELATCPDAKVRDAKRAVELAKKAVKLAPRDGNIWNTLGVAHFRSGDWKPALDGLTKSMELRKGGDGVDWFFLA